MAMKIELNTEKYVRVEPREVNDVLAKKISEARGIKLDDVKKILSLNVLSFKQIEIITGRSESHVRNDATPRMLRTGEMSVGFHVVNPFPDNRKGKMFILLDDKCITYIKNSLKEKK